MIKRFLRRFLGHSSAARAPGLNVHPTARVNLNSLVMRKGATLTVGPGSHVDAFICFDQDGAQVTIGERSYVTGSIFCARAIEIGDDVMIAGGGAIFDHDSHSLDSRQRVDDVRAWRADEKDWTHVPMSPVKIRNKSWIGWGVIIMKGVVVGEGAVIGAGSVVPRSIDDYTLAFGNPARPVRKVT